MLIPYLKNNCCIYMYEYVIICPIPVWIPIRPWPLQSDLLAAATPTVDLWLRLES